MNITTNINPNTPTVPVEKAIEALKASHLTRSVFYAPCIDILYGAEDVFARKVKQPDTIGEIEDFIIDEAYNYVFGCWENDLASPDSEDYSFAIEIIAAVVLACFTGNKIEIACAVYNALDFYGEF